MKLHDLAMLAMALAGSAGWAQAEETTRVYRQGNSSATITQSGRGYTGKFLDGAEGKGLDIISGSVSGDKVVMGINRNQLNGAMVASLRGENKMNITISIKVEDQMVPVIGLSLDRDMDSIAVGSINQ